MRKLTGGLIGLALLLCAFTAQAEEPIDVSGVSSEPLAMTMVVCSSNSDCASGAECLSAKVCVDDMSSAPTGATCTTNDDCDVGSSCEEMSICVDVSGCESDADCAGNPAGELCNLSTGQCVECFTDNECSAGEFCVDNMCEQDCELVIRPNIVKRSRNVKKPYAIKMLRIRGNEYFDPQAVNEAASFGPLAATNWQIRKRLLKVVVKVRTTTTPGVYPVRVGSCIGEIEIQ